MAIEEWPAKRPAMTTHPHSSKYSCAAARFRQRQLVIAALFCGMGCSGNDANERASGGTDALAGAPAGSGGSPGFAGSGGAANSATAGSNMDVAGGSEPSGGTTHTGGVSAVAASSVGGNSATGGSRTTGGSNATGASRTTGGSQATGGSRNEATTVSSGGLANTGGSKATGSSRVTGGTVSTGGTRSVGGSATTGGTSSGGSSNNGGVSGTDKCGRSVNITIPSGYSKLAWHDEFDVDGAPNSANWGYETGFVRNNELQWYQSKNAAVSAGLLVITGKRERLTNPNYSAGSSDWKKSRQYAEYTSASLSTSGKQTWKFGRFEMCGKIPIGSGMWPAWWALGVSGEWPSNGEIDMMEFYKGKILANVACGTSERWTAKWDSSTRSVDSSWAAAYHLWRMDWDDQKIDLYVDDSLMNSVPLSTMLNPDGKSPFLQNAYMIVNLAIGGDNGGDPAGTSFPQEYLIDYLRVFQ